MQSNMSISQPERDPDAGGHAKAAGGAILGLGGFFFVTAVLATQVFDLDLRFISGEGMMLFAGIYVLVGAQQIAAGRRLARRAR